MNELSKKYLKLSLDKLDRYLPIEPEALMSVYEALPSEYSVETDLNDLVYCMFSFPLFDTEDSTADKVILFVYDNETIIADCCYLNIGVEEALYSDEIRVYMENDGPWMDTEFCIFKDTLMDESEDDEMAFPKEGRTLFYKNVYVSRNYRRRGIFNTMLQMINEFAVRFAEDTTMLYSLISLDPDIPCYGPDSSDEPYIYSFEQDEPIRLLNASILKKKNFTPFRIDPVDTIENDDGSLLWFAMQCSRVILITEEGKA